MVANKSEGEALILRTLRRRGKPGCTGTGFLLKGNNLALLCPALGGGHTSCWRIRESDIEFVKKKSATTVFEPKNASHDIFQFATKVRKWFKMGLNQ